MSSSQPTQAGVAGAGKQYLSHQAWLLTPPWIGVAATMALGAVLRCVLAESAVRMAWGSAALVTATWGICWCTNALAKPRGKWMRIHSTLSVGLAGGWVVIVVITGFHSLAVDLLGLLCGAVCATVWNIRRIMRAGVPAESGGGWSDLSDKITMLKGRVSDLRQDGLVQRATVQLPPGVCANDAQNDAQNIAAALHVPPTGVRITPDPDDASKVQLSITPADMLREMIPWPGPTLSAGGSISDPVRLGRYEDGSYLELDLVTRLVHIIIAGMTGAGKSELITTLVGEVAPRQDVEISYIDIGGKAEQTVGPLRPGLDLLITDRGEAERYLKLLLASVRDRALALSAVGMKKWRRGAPIKFKMVVLDEAASLIVGKSSKDFTALARLLRSVGIMLVLALQRCTVDQIPSSARENFGGAICLGVRSSPETSRVLSEESTDAGAAPHVWKASKPGYLYAEMPSIPSEKWAMPARAFYAREEVISGVMAQIGKTPEAYQPLGLDLPARSASIVDTTQCTSSEEDGLDKLPRYEIPAELAREMEGIDPEAELSIPSGGGWEISLEAPDRIPPLTPAQASGAAKEFIMSNRSNLPPQFRRSDLIKLGILEVSGRKVGWLSGQLGNLVESGELARVGDPEDGVYTWN